MQGEIKYVDRIAQGAGRAVASVRLARAQAIKRRFGRKRTFGRIEAFYVACRHDTGVALS